VIGDLFPYGDADERMLRRAAERFPGLPIDDGVAAFDLMPCAVDLLETMAQPLRDAGVSPARWRLLGALLFQASPEGATIGELARHLGVREPTVTGTVRRAESDGLVKRTRSEEDRRVVTVTATEKGSETVAQLLPELAGRVKALVDAMGGPAETRNVAQALRSGVTAARKAPGLEIGQEKHATHR
jgi:DNA-binding MarR family transcriptional regulator